MDMIFHKPKIFHECNLRTRAWKEEVETVLTNSTTYHFSEKLPHVPRTFSWLISGVGRFHNQLMVSFTSQGFTIQFFKRASKYSGEETVTSGLDKNPDVRIHNEASWAFFISSFRIGAY